MTLKCEKVKVVLPVGRSLKRSQGQPWALHTWRVLPLVPGCSPPHNENITEFKNKQKKNKQKTMINDTLEMSHNVFITAMKDEQSSPLAHGIIL